MSAPSLALKLRNKAQAQLNFACRRLRKSIGGGGRTLENMSSEEWEASGKNVQKIADVLERKELDSSIVRGYGVEELTSEVKSKVANVVDSLESVMSGMSADDIGRFQVKEKLDAAKGILVNFERIEKALEELFTEERNDRKEWEEKNPRLAEQERELIIYENTLRGILLRKDSLNKLDKGEWIQALGCLKSMEAFLLEHKIAVERIKETKVEELLKELMTRFEDLDKDGIDRANFDVDTAERVWGLVDKLGSGVTWLMRSERLWTPGEPKPTTRSIFLLKSAPPAKMTFSADKKAWQEKELVRFRERISNNLLDEEKPITSDQEQRWSTAYKELEALQDFLKVNEVDDSSLQKTQMKTTLLDVGKRISVLHGDRGNNSDDGVGEFVLMYLTWECAMRLSKQFEEMGVK